ncbi:BRISC and BRCA1-A complex member 1-like isoform X2 [Montipora foliosa]|uniref:BRISC and BRCA1-A complex member 1-like isoform X2 n=1 Tax=Montipora foliosa TaxID=591990 RepID=UPI0035F21897
MEENRQRQFFDAELNGRDQRDAEDNSMDVDVQVDGEHDDEDGEETKQEQQQSNGIAESLSTSSDNSDNESLRSRVPRVNCPEHLILCLDLSPEMKSMSFQCKSVSERTIFQFVQRAVQIFVKTKSKMNPSHQFSIMVLDDKASWYKHFTNDVEVICSTLNRLSPEDELSSLGEFNMSGLFDAVRESVTLPEVEDILLPPPYIVRLVLVYGRSQCVPNVSPEAKKEIYDFFCDMDEEEEGYMLEVSRSTTRLFDHMAALLAHPLQRPKQRDTFYKLTPRRDEESIL